MSITKEELRTLIQQTISSSNPEIDVEFGPVYNIFINPTAILLEMIDKRLDYIKNIGDIDKLKDLSEKDLDSYARMFGIKRKQGTKATGIVTFFTTTVSTSPINIEQGTAVQTQEGVRFVTTQPFFVLPDSIELYKNPITSRYEFHVSVEAVEEGSQGNVPASSISLLLDIVPGIKGVVNKTATIGGYDRETNEQFANKIKLVLQGGLNPSSINGTIVRLLANNYIKDVRVEKQKPIVPGTIDFYYIGSKMAYEEEIAYWYGFNTYFKKRPVIEVVEVVSGGNVFVPGVDYIFSRDTSSAYARTSRANDKIVWLENGSRPSYKVLL